MCPPDRESACDVGIRIRGRRAGTGANPIRPVPISAGPHVNRLERKRGRIGPNVRNRRAENTDRNHQSIVRPIAGTEPDGEEPGRGNDGDRAGTCMVLRKEASLQPFESRTRRRTPAGVRGQIPAGELSKDLFEDFNIVADKATSTNSLESMLDLIEQSLDTDRNTGRASATKPE